MRYFLEVSYKGTRYSGFQVQQNALTIQGEIEKALQIFLRHKKHQHIQLTGSSRTDAGVHALQNFFHFDFDDEFQTGWLYNINAILPADIVLKNILPVAPQAHCRFDAVSRSYSYYIYAYKNPFIADTAYFYPYPININLLNEAAGVLKNYIDFTSFSKKNTQVKTFNCNIMESYWQQQGDALIYTVKANRFLRGMVRALVATMLQVGRGTITVQQFKQIIEDRNNNQSKFDAPGHGLTLVSVNY